jgi:hypothetical protein
VEKMKKWQENAQTVVEHATNHVQEKITVLQGITSLVVLQVVITHVKISVLRHVIAHV